MRQVALPPAARTRPGDLAGGDNWARPNRLPAGQLPLELPAAATGEA